MANYFVDSGNGNDADDGTTMDAGGGGGTGAWATLKHALASGGLSAGDIVWVRRTHSEVEAAAQWDTPYDGTSDSHIKVIGWPRAADASITSATWTNGSRTVDLIVGLSMDTEQHITRYITGPDGERYMITLITDANTIQLEREYAGTTATLTDGACTIHADEDWYDDMGTQYSFDDSGWTIKESNWDADADDLPTIDFSGGAWYINLREDNYWYLANLYVICGTSTTYGGLYFRQNSTSTLRGCYVYQSAGANTVSVVNSTLYMHRVVILSTAANANNKGLAPSGSRVCCEDVVIDGCHNGIYTSAHSMIVGNGLYLGLNTVNSYNYYIFETSELCAVDYYEGTASAANIITARESFWDISIENYNLSLGAHKRYTSQGEITKDDVVLGSGDPYMRSGGNSSVIEVLFNRTGAILPDQPEYHQVAYPVFIHEFEATADSKDYRYYVQAEGAVTAEQLFIECEYLSAYDDASEYVIKKVTSDEAITTRDDAGDWDQYIEVTGIQPVVASKVRITCYCTYYHATNKIYIDPLPEIA